MMDPMSRTNGTWSTQFLALLVFLHSNASCLFSCDAFTDNPSPDNRNIAGFFFFYTFFKFSTWNS